MSSLRRHVLGVAAALLLPALGARADALLDLGQNLFYVRLTPPASTCPSPALGSSLSALDSAVAAAAPALIVDLRDPAPDASLTPLLQARAGLPTLVLLGAGAPPLPRLPGLLTVGPPATRPDFEITPPPDALSARLQEYRATGLTRETLETLITENAAKRRYDEAAVVREHTTGQLEPDEPAPSATPPATPVVPPLLDLALQRAVHIHRGLLALKKI